MRRDVLDVEERRPGLRCGAAADLGLSRCDADRQILRALPAQQVAVRVDHPVVAEPEQRGRVDLEVQVRRGSASVAGVADEADHVARPNPNAVLGER